MLQWANLPDEKLLDLRLSGLDLRIEGRGNPSAAAFLSQVRKQVRRSVARRTGVYQYTIDRVIEDMITRCRHHDLRLRGTTEETKLEFAILLTAHTMDYLHSGRYRCAL